MLVDACSCTINVCLQFCTVPSPQPETKSPEASTSADGAKPDASMAMADFFSAIEEEQPTMFNPQTGRFVLILSLATLTAKFD